MRPTLLLYCEGVHVPGNLFTGIDAELLRQGWPHGARAVTGGIADLLAGEVLDGLDAGTFEPAGVVLDLITILTVLFGLVLAGYLIYTERSLG